MNIQAKADVRCTECGRVLKGTQVLGTDDQWRISRHNQVRGVPCQGSDFTDHKRVSEIRWALITVEPLVLAYAIRYCMNRNSYAFTDGVALAREHWAILDEATKDDVIAVIGMQGWMR